MPTMALDTSWIKADALLRATPSLAPIHLLRQGIDGSSPAVFKEGGNIFAHD